MRASSTILSLAPALVAALLAHPPAAHAQARVIEDVRVSAGDGQVAIRIEFACRMRFVADSSAAGGVLLELRVAPFDDCSQQGLVPGQSAETYRPPGSEEVGLVEMEFASLGAGDGVLLLSFARPVRYSVSQLPSMRAVEIVVTAGDDAVAPAPAEPAGRRPLSVRVVEPEVAPDYIVNLLSTREPVDSGAPGALDIPPGSRLYVSQIRVDGEVWNRLRIGFFATEGDARTALERLRQAYPRAWVGRAEPAEVELASGSALPLEGGRVRTLAAEDLERAAGAAGPGAPRASPGAPPAAADVPGLMAEARERLLDGDNEGALELYGAALLAAGDHRAAALEFQGLAYERTDQLARARSVYEQNLREFPDNPDRSRVEQRLDSVMARLEQPPAALRAAPAEDDGSWDASMGLSQYYRRNDSSFDEALPEQTTQSALLTDADLSLSHSGRNLDMLARVSIGHYHDLLDAGEGGRGDEARVSSAYVDFSDTGGRWDLRTGRQSLHSLGVLGRFDGAHASIGAGGKRRVHMTLGYPVESTRDGVDSANRITGLAGEFDDVVGSWDLATFLNAQTVEGIDARLATGLEARYLDERRSFTGLVDYDIDYGELNMLLALGTWRLPQGLTLSATLDRRLSPILTTRNALIGQPVETIGELLLVWTEDEVRRLAADRTAQSQSVTAGLAAPLGERLQLNFDVTMSEFEGTAESGGVAAVPGTGRQTFYSATLVTSGLLAATDVQIWSLRVGAADNFQTSLLTWDGRFPVGRHWRINPRLRLATWESPGDFRRRETVSPALRLLLNVRNRYRFELETGRDDMTRTDALGESTLSGRYVYLGYQAFF